MSPFAATCIFLAHRGTASVSDVLWFVRAACDNPDLTRGSLGIADLVSNGEVLERNGQLVASLPDDIRHCWASQSRSSVTRAVDAAGSALTRSS